MNAEASRHMLCTLQSLLTSGLQGHEALKDLEGGGMGKGLLRMLSAFFGKKRPAIPPRSRAMPPATLSMSLWCCPLPSAEP